MKKVLKYLANSWTGLILYAVVGTFLLALGVGWEPWKTVTPAPVAVTAEALTATPPNPQPKIAAVTVPSDTCPGELNRAVLNKLYPLVGDTPDTIARLDRYDVKVQCLREWAMSIPDYCMRAEYLSWLEYYAGRSKYNRDSLADSGNVVDKYERKRKEEDRRVAEYERTHKIPVPEACDLDTIRRAK